MTSQIWYELRNAVYEKEFSVANSLLQAHPELIDLRNGIGETALQFLAVENDIEGVNWLFHKGFNINEKNLFGTPIIFEVIELQYKELFQWFVDNGADLQITDRDGREIISYLNKSNNQEIIDYLKKEFPHKIQ